MSDLTETELAEIARLAEYIEKNEWTGKDAAEKFGISQPYMSRILCQQLAIDERIKWTIRQRFGNCIADELFGAPQVSACNGHKQPAP